MKDALFFAASLLSALPAYSQEATRGFDPEVPGIVHALLVLPDDKIVVGGDFKPKPGGVAGGLARFHPDGTLDTKFAADDMAINCIVPFGDGTIVAGGRRMVANNGCVARFLADGSIDPAFNVTLDGEVRAVAVQRDKKIVIGGFFTNVSNLDRRYIARLNVDGTPDASFEPPPISPEFASIQAVAVQSDGKVLFGGFYNHVADVEFDGLVRLQPNGRFDPTFHREVSGAGAITSIVIQPDGKILAAGSLLVTGGHSSRIARLHPDGAIDKSFKAEADPHVQAMALQPDGKIVVGGWFNELNRHKSKYLGRLNAEGSFDNTFNASADSLIYALALQRDGKIIVGGQITSLSGRPCKYLGRVNSDGSADSAAR